MNQEEVIAEVLRILGPLIYLVAAIWIFMIVCMWKIFVKAGQPGWACIVPFYNLYVFTQVVQRPKWWMLLYFLSIVPIVGSIAVLVIMIMDYIKLANVFGKGGGFAVGLILLNIVFFPILAFGDATYNGQAMANDDLLDQ